VTNLHQLTSQSTTSCLQRGDRIVTTDYYDVRPPVSH